MLVIRMQRTGRKGHAQFRVVVQDSRRTPTSGSIVASLGSFNPHTKEAILDKEKASFYLEHGAQPSERVVRLLKAQGVKLPSWVKVADGDKQRVVRNADKRRSTRPADAEAVADKPAESEETDSPEAPVDEKSAEEVEETAAEPETPAEEPAAAEPAAEAEAPAEETAEKPAE